MQNQLISEPPLDCPLGVCIPGLEKFNHPITCNMSALCWRINGYFDASNVNNMPIKSLAMPENSVHSSNYSNVWLNLV